MKGKRLAVLGVATAALFVVGYSLMDLDHTGVPLLPAGTAASTSPALLVDETRSSTPDSEVLAAPQAQPRPTVAKTSQSVLTPGAVNLQSAAALLKTDKFASIIEAVAAEGVGIAAAAHNTYEFEKALAGLATVIQMRSWAVRPATSPCASAPCSLGWTKRNGTFGETSFKSASRCLYRCPYIARYVSPMDRPSTGS